MKVPSYQLKGKRYTLRGTATDDTNIEDVYIFVSNRSAKIDNRKVFYKSNRGAKKNKSLSFASDIPLWPGSNLVTIVARENGEVKSSHTMFLYRTDGVKTATTAQMH